MSFWWHKRDESDKKILWEIDFDPMILLIILGVLAAIVGPSLLRNPSIILFIPFMLLLAGLSCLILAKISVYRKGIWFSFGSRHMSRGYARLYWAAYALLGLGVLLLPPLLTALQK